MKLLSTSSFFFLFFFFFFFLLSLPALLQQVVVQQVEAVNVLKPAVGAAVTINAASFEASNGDGHILLENLYLSGLTFPAESISTLSSSSAFSSSLTVTVRNCDIGVIRIFSVAFADKNNNNNIIPFKLIIENSRLSLVHFSPSDAFSLGYSIDYFARANITFSNCSFASTPLEAIKLNSAYDYNQAAGAALRTASSEAGSTQVFLGQNIRFNHSSTLFFSHCKFVYSSDAQQGRPVFSSKINGIIFTSNSHFVFRDSLVDVSNMVTTDQILEFAFSTIRENSVIRVEDNQIFGYRVTQNLILVTLQGIGKNGNIFVLNNTLECKCFLLDRGSISAGGSKINYMQGKGGTAPLLVFLMYFQALQGEVIPVIPDKCTEIGQVIIDNNRITTPRCSLNPVGVKGGIQSFFGIFIGLCSQSHLSQLDSSSSLLGQSRQGTFSVSNNFIDGRFPPSNQTSLPIMLALNATQGSRDCGIDVNSPFSACGLDLINWSANEIHLEVGRQMRGITVEFFGGRDSFCDIGKMIVSDNFLDIGVAEHTCGVLISGHGLCKNRNAPDCLLEGYLRNIDYLELSRNNVTAFNVPDFINETTFKDCRDITGRPQDVVCLARGYYYAQAINHYSSNTPFYAPTLRNIKVFKIEDNTFDIIGSGYVNGAELALVNSEHVGDVSIRRNKIDVVGVGPSDLKQFGGIRFGFDLSYSGTVLIESNRITTFTTRRAIMQNGGLALWSTRNLTNFGLLRIINNTVSTIGEHENPFTTGGVLMIVQTDAETHGLRGIEILNNTLTSFSNSCFQHNCVGMMFFIGVLRNSGHCTVSHNTVVIEGPVSLNGFAFVGFRESVREIMFDGKEGVLDMKKIADQVFSGKTPRLEVVTEKLADVVFTNIRIDYNNVTFISRSRTMFLRYVSFVGGRLDVAGNIHVENNFFSHRCAPGNPEKFSLSPVTSSPPYVNNFGIISFARYLAVAKAPMDTSRFSMGFGTIVVETFFSSATSYMTIHGQVVFNKNVMDLRELPPVPSPPFPGLTSSSSSSSSSTSLVPSQFSVIICDANFSVFGKGVLTNDSSFMFAKGVESFSLWNFNTFTDPPQVSNNNNKKILLEGPLWSDAQSKPLYIICSKKESAEYNIWDSVTANVSGKTLGWVHCTNPPATKSSSHTETLALTRGGTTELSESAQTPTSSYTPTVHVDPDLTAGLTASVVGNLSTATFVVSAVSSLTAAAPMAVATASRGIAALSLLQCVLTPLRNANETERYIRTRIESSLGFPISLFPGFGFGDQRAGFFARGAAVSFLIAFVILPFIGFFVGMYWKGQFDTASKDCEDKLIQKVRDEATVFEHSPIARLFIVGFAFLSTGLATVAAILCFTGNAALGVIPLLIWSFAALVAAPRILYQRLFGSELSTSQRLFLMPTALYYGAARSERQRDIRQWLSTSAISRFLFFGDKGFDTKTGLMSFTDIKKRNYCHPPGIPRMFGGIVLWHRGEEEISMKKIEQQKLEKALKARQEKLAAKKKKEEGGGRKLQQQEGGETDENALALLSHQHRPSSHAVSNSSFSAAASSPFLSSATAAAATSKRRSANSTTPSSASSSAGRADHYSFEMSPRNIEASNNNQQQNQQQEAATRRKEKEKEKRNHGENKEEEEKELSSNEIWRLKLSPFQDIIDLYLTLIVVLCEGIGMVEPHSCHTLLSIVVTCNLFTALIAIWLRAERVKRKQISVFLAHAVLFVQFCCIVHVLENVRSDENVEGSDPNKPFYSKEELDSTVSAAQLITTLGLTILSVAAVAVASIFKILILYTGSRIVSTRSLRRVLKLEIEELESPLLFERDPESGEVKVRMKKDGDAKAGHVKGSAQVDFSFM